MSSQVVKTFDGVNFNIVKEGNDIWWWGKEVTDVAFAGAGFIFSKLNHTGYENEIKRHNAALESLAKAKEVWYENEVKKKDRINELRQELSDANRDRF